MEAARALSTLNEIDICYEILFIPLDRSMILYQSCFAAQASYLFAGLKMQTINNINYPAEFTPLPKAERLTDLGWKPNKTRNLINHPWPKHGLAKDHSGQTTPK